VGWLPAALLTLVSRLLILNSKGFPAMSTLEESGKQPSDNSDTRARAILGVPAWLAFSIITILLYGAWGATSKVVSGDLDASTNQVFFTIGLLPLVPVFLRSRRVVSGQRRGSGVAWAFITGILSALGNIAFFRALAVGGKASIVVPASALSPLVTVILAVTILRERISGKQWTGLALALSAIYLLTV
jgi:bacterial/archaeal transporter family protein